MYTYRSNRKLPPTSTYDHKYGKDLRCACMMICFQGNISGFYTQRNHFFADMPRARQWSDSTIGCDARKWFQRSNIKGLHIQTCCQNYYMSMQSFRSCGATLNEVLIKDIFSVSCFRLHEDGPRQSENSYITFSIHCCTRKCEYDTLASLAGRELLFRDSIDTNRSVSWWHYLHGIDVQLTMFHHWFR